MSAIHANAREFDAKAEGFFRYVQVFTAIVDSYSHGANDVSNAMPPRFDCRGRNWPEDPGTCVIEHLRKHDVVPESGETVVETPHVSPTVVRRAGFFVVVVLGPVVWVVASRC